MPVTTQTPDNICSDHAVPDTAEQPRDFFALDTELRPELIKGLVREGQICCLGGAYGAGKTPLLTDLAIHVINGLPWCGRAVQRRPVVVFDFESPGATYRRDLIRLCKRLELKPPAVPDELNPYLARDNSMTANTVKLLEAMERPDEAKFLLLETTLELRPDALVIVDPTELLFAFNKLKGAEVIKFYQRFRKISIEFPKAVIILTFNLLSLAK